MNELSSPIPSVSDVMSLCGPSGSSLRVPKDAGQAVQVAKDFESILVTRLLNEMRSSVPEDGLFGDGVSKQVEDMFWYYLGQEIGSKGGLGIWQEIYRQMPQGHPAGDGGTTEQLL
jgi:Rod binding domain-containing protein